ncbi:hypothetical protein [Desulfobacula sp.]|uniref:hypothetical protein n=1 Tax=Desulfobacula sp. TaxID=2593537 RepID=UPI0025BC12CF|nr:hypothetical protein [Desulfobacula sp.]MBC2705308.1 hypothetical protein [Desulfobacula sp.]
MFGSIAIIAATIIFSVAIQSIDGKLNSISEKISQQKTNSIIYKQLLSSIAGQFLERRLDFFERNNRIINKAGFNIRNELEDKILDITKKIIVRQKGSLIENGSNKSGMISLKQELDSIIKDPNMSFSVKLDKLEPIREKTASSLNDRFINYQSELNKLRKKEKDHKKRKLFWNCLFIWLQVTGLIALSFGELLGTKVSFYSIKEKTAHNKTN